MFCVFVVEYVDAVVMYCNACKAGKNLVHRVERVPTRMTSHEPSIHDGTYAGIDGSHLVMRAPFVPGQTTTAVSCPVRIHTVGIVCRCISYFL